METFEYKGLRFRCEIEHDPTMGEPWKEHDGHGVVSEWTERAKKPGELILATDYRESHRFYDFAETVKIALRDGWGPPQPGKSPHQNAEAATRADYQRMKAWCDDEWHWVSVTVDLLDLEGHVVPGFRESLSGIESDAGDYFQEVREELAGQISSDLEGKTEVCLKIREVAGV